LGAVFAELVPAGHLKTEGIGLVLAGS